MEEWAREPGDGSFPSQFLTVAAVEVVATLRIRKGCHWGVTKPPVLRPQGCHWEGLVFSIGGVRILRIVGKVTGPPKTGRIEFVV